MTPARGGESRTLWLGFLGASVLAMVAAAWVLREKATIMRLFVAFVVPVGFMWGGLRKKSLALSGAAMGWVVACTHGMTSYAIFGNLVVFFVTGSKFTKYKAKEKQKFEADFQEGGQRNWVQVTCNGGPAFLFSLCLLALQRVGDFPIDFKNDWLCSYLQVAALGSYACACGDTWASELGSVLGGTPVLITSGKQVPRGTNGGVSFVGLGASALGGLCIGVGHYLLVIIAQSNEPAPPQWPIIVAGLFGGLLGSIIDSLLGATLQYSGVDSKGRVHNSPGPDTKHVCGVDILDNHQVNLLAALVTGLLMPLLCAQVWP